MHNKKKLSKILGYVCVATLMISMMGSMQKGNICQAENAVIMDSSDLLTANLIFKDKDASYMQPIVNFLKDSSNVTTGLDAYYALNKDTTLLDQYINALNDVLATQVYSNTALNMIDEQNGIYHSENYVMKFGDEARKYLDEQLVYHACGVQMGNIEIDLSEVPLETVYLGQNDQQVALQMIGTYQTDYRTSSASRCNNVELAASNFNNTLVKPNETISVSELFKRRTKENGYQMAGVFLNGETTQGMGGGICQVSTTIYCASLDAGLAIVERHSHSLPVSYVPKGMDATISYPSLDLKIQNNKEMPIVFKTTTAGKKIKVEIYSLVSI